MSVAVGRNYIQRRASEWHLAVGGLLFIVMTQLYRPIAVVLGLTDLTLVTGTITALCLLYLMLGRVRSIISVHDFPLLAVAIVGFPLFSMIYAEQHDWRSFLIQIHYFLLMLAAAKCFRSRGMGERAMAAALVVSFIGLGISILWPQVFAPMAAMADARYDYHGRGSGLFLQPNLFAHNLVLLMLTFYLARNQGRSPVLLPMAALFLLALFLTGSRGGLIAGSVFLLGLVLVERKLSDPRAPILALLAAFAAAGGWILWDMLSLGGFDLSLYIARVTSMFSNDVLYDGSVAHRLAFQEAFIQRIREAPVLGYGLGSVNLLLSQGRLLGSAHNQFLDLALQYGMVGIGMMLLCAMRLYKHIRDYRPDAGSIRAWLILITLGLSMMGTNMVMDMQNFYILLGVAFAIRNDAVRRGRPAFRLGGLRPPARYAAGRTALGRY